MNRNGILILIALILLPICANNMAMQPDAPQEMQHEQLKMLYLGIPIKELEEYIRLQNNIEALAKKMKEQQAAQENLVARIPSLTTHAQEVSEYRALYNKTYCYPPFLNEKKS